MDIRPHNCLKESNGMLCAFMCFVMMVSMSPSSSAQALDMTTEKTAFQLESIQFSPDGQLELSWMNEGALRYEVDYREDLNRGPWIKLTDVQPAEGPLQTHKLSRQINPPTAFYRIRKIPDPLDALLTLVLSESISMEFIKIHAGTFVMGSPPDEHHRENDEGPLTEVTLLNRFLLGKYEVTQAQWKAVMDHDPSRFKGDHLPVERVSWTLAVSFCERLTEQERDAGRLPEGYAYTLPTEAQWEYACRAGSRTRFSFGDDQGYDHLDAYAWYWSNSGSQTRAVGQKEPNAWGLHDMHGNVWEWCMDVYANTYPGGSLTDPQGPQSGAVRVIRGGGWEDFARDCRSACRLRAWPGNSFSYLGFRVALSAVALD